MSTDISPRERLNKLLDAMGARLGLRAGKELRQFRAEWLEILELARSADLSPFWKPKQGWDAEPQLQPLPTLVNLVGNPEAMAAAKKQLPTMNPNSDAYLLLSRQLEQ